MLVLQIRGTCFQERGCGLICTGLPRQVFTVKNSNTSQTSSRWEFLAAYFIGKAEFFRHVFGHSLSQVAEEQLKIKGHVEIPTFVQARLLWKKQNDWQLNVICEDDIEQKLCPALGLSCGVNFTDIVGYPLRYNAPNSTRLQNVQNANMQFLQRKSSTLPILFFYSYIYLFPGTT